MNRLSAFLKHKCTSWLRCSNSVKLKPFVSHLVNKMKTGNENDIRRKTSEGTFEGFLFQMRICSY